MFEFIKRLAVWLVIFLIIDFAWLGFVAKSFYDKYLKSFERTINWPAAFFTYILIGLGIVFFVLPLTKDKALHMSFLVGAVYGLVVYGVYDLTNLATLKNWSLSMVLVDIIWGMFICSTTSLILRIIFE